MRSSHKVHNVGKAAELCNDHAFGKLYISLTEADKLPRLHGLDQCAAGSGWSEALAEGAGLDLHSCAAAAFRGSDTAHQSPPGAP